MEQAMRRWWSMGMLIGLVALSGCGLIEDEPVAPELDPVELEQRRGDLTPFCAVDVQGYGNLSVEDEYLAKVVMCENGGGTLQSLKAQAVAARGYAKFVVDVERRAVAPSVRDQHYDCGRTPSAEVIQAVRETAGEVLTHNGRLIMPFYVAGSTGVNSQCKASGGASTQRYVTYNHGHIGGQVHPTTLGSTTNPANRGAMSQNGANCLANKGWDYKRILRFFYGDDIRVTNLGGTCGGQADDPIDDGPPLAGDDSGTCTSAQGAPTIVERSQWGAEPPRSNRSPHTPRRFTIHHTVTANNDPDPYGTVRQIQHFHKYDRGWADIGYHFLIGPNGTIFRGNPEGRIGAHVGGMNTGNLGISFLGSYHLPSGQPSDAQLKAAGQLIRHLADKYGIAVSSSTVGGHRDFGATSCPGQNLYDAIGRIIGYATADVVCTPPSSGGSTSPVGGQPGTGDEEMVELDAAFRYVRLRAVDDQPTGLNDSNPGYDVDAVYLQPKGTMGSADITPAASAHGTGVTNAQAAVGPPNNMTCADRQTTLAGISEGGELILEFPRTFGPDDTVTVVQSSMDALACGPSGRAEVAVSNDGQSWTVIDPAAVGNPRIDVKGATLQFIEPTDGGTYPAQLDLAVQASPQIAAVAYFADGWPLGTSSDGQNFQISYSFENTGLRHLVAKGYDAAGNFVAKAEIDVTLTEAFDFITPSADRTYMPNVRFTVHANDPAIVEVAYEADDWEFGRSSNGASDFKVDYEFQNMGSRHIVAKGLDSSGNVVATAERTIEVARNGAALEFISPSNRGWYTRQVTFKVLASHPAIDHVHYEADGWEIGQSNSASNDYEISYRFNHTGTRQITAIGMDANGREVARETIAIVVSDDTGAIDSSGALTPVSGGGGQTSEPDPASGGQSTSGPAVDTATGNRLGDEGGICSARGNGSGGPRCQNGRGGWSTGHCWKFVKGAMIRANVGTRADINELAGYGPCTAYQAQVSARGFKCAADAAPSALERLMGLKRVNTPPTQAPRGAIIAWEKGCMGAHSRYGHIEIATGDGYACSDYCAPIRGDASCASVYVPVN